MLTPAIRRIKDRAGRAPAAVTADRGYGDPSVEAELRDEGVRHARTRLDGIAGARTWVGRGIFNHNLVKFAGLLP